MAKEHTQDDLFPVIPEIAGLGITGFKIKGGSVQGIIEGATNTNDIALLDSPCWQKAVAAWAIELHGGDVDAALISVKKAYIDWVNRNGETVRETPVSTSKVTFL